MGGRRWAGLQEAWAQRREGEQYGWWEVEVGGWGGVSSLCSSLLLPVLSLLALTRTTPTTTPAGPSPPSGGLLPGSR